MGRIKSAFLILLLLLAIPAVGSQTASVNSAAIHYTRPPFFWPQSMNTLITFIDGLFISGDFNQTDGYSYVNLVHAEMYNYSSSGSPYTFDIDTGGVYYNLTGLSPQHNSFTFVNEIEANGGSYFITTTPGTYKVSLSMSFGSEAQGGLYGIGVAEGFDITQHRECYSRRAAASAVGSVSVTCFIHLDIGQTVNVQVENENGNRDMYIHTVNFNLFRVGDV